MEKTFTNVADLESGDRVVCVGSSWGAWSPSENARIAMAPAIGDEAFVSEIPPGTSGVFGGCAVWIRDSKGNPWAINNTDWAVLLVSKKGDTEDTTMKNNKQYMVLYKATGEPMRRRVADTYGYAPLSAVALKEQITLLIEEGFSKNQLEVVELVDVPFEVEIVPKQITVTVE